MNVGAHQGGKENEKSGKGRAEEKKQSLLHQVLPFQFVISLNPVFLDYRIAYVCFVSMFPYLALFLARLALC